MSEYNIFVNPALNPNMQIHYKQEMKRAEALFKTPTLPNPLGADHNFISARHDDNFNDFERHWISPLEKIV